MGGGEIMESTSEEKRATLRIMGTQHRDNGGKGQDRKRDKDGDYGKGLGQELRRRGRTDKTGHYKRRPDVERFKT